MQEPRSFAYTLSQREDGWAWQVYDENGLTVDLGVHASRSAAEAAIDRALQRSSGTEEAAA